MEFRLLGPVEAWHDGSPVPLGDAQQRFVLVVLLLNPNKPVSAERLADIVWGGDDRRGLVRTYITRLRRALAVSDEVVIETAATGYVLRVDEDSIDAPRFDRLRQRARDEPDLAAVGLLRTAVGLWRGRFLEDIDIDRVGGPAVYTRPDDHLDTVGDLAELELRVGDPRSARDRLRRAVAAAPANQKLAELLMRALMACGDGLAAVRVFQDATAALRREGFEPGPVLRNLAARAARGEPVSSLTSRPAAFTGRTDELAAITGARRPVVWVSGAPGVGKTGLAVEAAHRLRDRYPDGQVLVRLNGFTPGVAPTAVGDALTQLLVELGVPPEQVPATDARKATLYQTELHGRRVLIVLDSAQDAEQVRLLLPEAAGCFTVVTSRKVAEPGVAEHIRLAPLPRADATALFRALVGDSPRLRGRAADVDRVADRCGYLPMPIRLVAALFGRHERWPLEHLVGLLEHNGPWQDGGAALRVSYQQLDEPQRELFRLLGHLPGPHVHVTGAAALAGRDAGWARKVLDELHGVCLVEELSPERYLVLDPLKEYAASLSPGGEALARLVEFSLATLRRAVDAAYPFDQSLPVDAADAASALEFASADDALGWIDAERDNLVAAVGVAAERGMTEAVWQLAVLIWRHFNTTNQMEDWVATLELARAAVDSDLGRAHVLLRLAIAHDRLGRLTDAVRLAEEAVPLWAGLGDTAGEAKALCALAVPLSELGRLDSAAEHFADALAKYRVVGDLRGQAHALSMLGYIDEQRGELHRALERQRAAVPILRRIEFTQGLAHALNNMGTVLHRLGHPDDALAAHDEAHALALAVNDNCVAAYALTNIAAVHRSRLRLAEAMEHHDRARLTAADVTDPDLMIQLDHDRATTHLARHDLADALRGFQAALDLASGTGNRTHQALAHRGIARTEHAFGRHAQAREHWTAATELFTALGHPGAAEIRVELAATTCWCRPA